MIKNVQDLNEGDLIWVPVHGTVDHLAIVIKNPSKRPRGKGDNKWVVKCYTLSHTRPSTNHCFVEIPCTNIPLNLFGKSCIDNSAPTFLRTDNPIKLAPEDTVKFKENVSIYKQLLDDVCKAVLECPSERSNTLPSICPCTYDGPKDSSVKKLEFDSNLLSRSNPAIGILNSTSWHCNIGFYCPKCCCSWGNEANFNKICESCSTHSFSN